MSNFRLEMMNKFRCLIITLLICHNSYGQLADGSTAQDFTFTDISGNTQNLYNYLNQGKYVVLDVSATWCNPCWTYHNQKVVDSIYNKHDQPGDNTWKVIFIEADPNTNSADLNGTGGNKVGNWVQGNNYTIIDPPSGAALSTFKTDYNISFYPTLYLICPDKKVIADTLNKGSKPDITRWEYAANKCSSLGIDNSEGINSITFYPNPAKGVTTIYLNLQATYTLTISISDMLGKTLESKSYKLQTGTQTLKYDISYLQPGIYFFKITSNNQSITKKLMVL